MLFSKYFSLPFLINEDKTYLINNLTNYLYRQKVQELLYIAKLFNDSNNKEFKKTLREFFTKMRSWLLPGFYFISYKIIHIFFSTINRNPQSFLFAILGAEYILGLLPKGTHEYARTCRPAAAACMRAQVQWPPLLDVAAHFVDAHALLSGFSANILHGGEPHGEWHVDVHATAQYARAPNSTEPIVLSFMCAPGQA
jgi:hypothetical protein